MSSVEQLKGRSLARQLELSKLYADERGLLLDTSLRDLGLSAFTGENRAKGALGRFLAMVGAGQIQSGSHLLVESFDRLSREQVLEALSVFMSLLSAGIVVHTLADGQVYSKESVGENPVQIIASIVYMMRAHEESLRKSQRIGDAWAKKRQEIGNKKLTKRAPYWLSLNSVTDNFDIDESRAAIVRRIFKETAEGIGTRTIAKRLNVEGVAAFGIAQGWHASYIKKILSNEAVIGRFQPCRKVGLRRVPDGDVVSDYYPPIVDPTLYARALAARVSRQGASNGGRRGASFANLLTGICLCWQCSGKLTLRDKGKKGGRYLACDNSLRGRGCTNRTHFRYPELEAAILDSVSEFDFAEVVGQSSSKVEEIEGLMAVIAQEVGAARSRRKRLLDAFESDIEIDEEIRSRTRSLRDLIDGKEKEMTTLRRRLAEARFQAAPPDAVSLLTQLRAEHTSASPEVRFALRAKMAQAIRSFIDFINFDGDAGTVDVVILGGVRAYRFVDGKLIASVSLYPLIDRHAGIPIASFTFGDPDRERRLRIAMARNSTKSAA